MRLNPLHRLFRRWLDPELPKWVASGVIQPEQEQRIREQYASEANCPGVSRLAKLTLIALAALMLGLALLVIICDYWASIPWLLKIGPTVLAMLAAHCGGYWFRFRREQSVLGERLFLLGTVLYGCGIWLVADHWHAAAEFPLGVFLWAVGALPLALVLNSLPLLLLTSGLASMWIVWQTLSGDRPGDVSLFLGFVLCFVYWAYSNRSRGVLVLAVLSLALWWAMLAIALHMGLQGLFWIASLGLLLFVIGLWHEGSHPFALVYRWIGAGLVGLMLPLLAMPSVSSDVLAAGNSLRYSLAWWVPLVGAALAWFRRREPIRANRAWAIVWAVATLAITILPAIIGLLSRDLPVLDETLATVVLAGVFSVAVVTLTGALVIGAAAANRPGCVGLGVVYLATWAALLCCDLARQGQAATAAIAFVLAGAALLAAARYGMKWLGATAGDPETVEVASPSVAEPATLTQSTPGVEHEAVPDQGS